MGIVVIMTGFIATAIVGEYVRKEALPSVPLLIENPDGSIPSLQVRPDLPMAREDQVPPAD